MRFYGPFEGISGIVLLDTPANGVREILATREAEKLASKMDWPTLIKERQPAQRWFDGDEAKPF